MRKWTKKLAAFLAAALVVTQTQVNVLAEENGASLGGNSTVSENDAEDAVITNDENGIPDSELYNLLLQAAGGGDNILTVGRRKN